MGYKFKGFLYGLVLMIVFTLILAPMIFGSLDNGTGLHCNYFCTVKILLIYYLNPFAILFFLINWFLGLKIAKLSYLLAHSVDDRSFRRKKSYTWLWEHKLKTVED